MSGYTVIDFETTGLAPGLHDRVVEVGVVYVSDRGDIEGEWESLINPQRDVGPTHIHGIGAREVLGAPTFGKIAPHLINSVAGRTITAHNSAFDLRFLEAELATAGVPLPTPRITGLCTMKWSTTFLAAPSRGLGPCCVAAGIRHQNVHSALGDARATAELLAYYLRSCHYRPPWAEELATSRAIYWSQESGSLPEVAMVTRTTAALARPEGGWLDRIVAHMPRARRPEVDAYLALLESALLDQYISVHEQEALVSIAAELGLGRVEAVEIHGAYLDTMAMVALADGVVSVDELADLERVAQLLGLPADAVMLALERIRSRPVAGERIARFRLRATDRIVLTGDMAISRDVWTERATRSGLEVGGITKSTKILVAADPDSMSGKAKKARGYGVPVIGEAAFEKLLLELEDEGRCN